MLAQISLIALSALTLPALAQTPVSVGYDTTFDNGSASLSTVACSTGTYGLETAGYTTFGSLPSFPNISAAPAVTGYDSPACGSCWQLSYAVPARNATLSVYVTAVDVGRDGFVASQAALDALTGGLAQELGRVTANATQVATSNCGL